MSDHGDLEESSRATFRRKVQRFFVDNAQHRIDGHLDSPATADEDAIGRAVAFQKAKFDAGLAGLTWPREYGGQGLDSSFQTIYNDEASNFLAPDGIFTIGFGMCLPTVLAHGTESLKRRYVLPALRGEEIWCQMFSEPSAGSDVASLQSKVVRDGDEWILTGQKVWTTQAHRCAYGIVLARTNPDVPKHKGLSMFVVDMHAPGVTIRPLKQMNGGSSFNEIFFDDVRIPLDHILGEPGEGWRVALTTLMNERVAIGAGRSAEGGSRLAAIQLHLDVASRQGVRDDQLIRQALVGLFIRYKVLDLIGLRIRSTVAAGQIPGPEGSVAKLAGALLARDASDVACRILGMAAIASDPEDQLAHQVAQMVLTAPAGGIAGGTSEVMRNIIGERVLGLPKEPSVDKAVPLSQLIKS